MRNIRVILVDDEPLAIKGLRLRLAEYDDVEIVAECRNGREAIQKIREEEPDLAFLDIQMPGLDGFAVIRSLIGHHMPLTVFVTAFDEYALKAFEAHAVDYLLKPVDDERLAEAVRQVRMILDQQSAIEQNARLVHLIENMDDPPEVILSAILDNPEPATSAQYDKKYDRQLHIKDRGTITRVDIDSIDYVEAAGDYMCIHTPDKTHILRATMKTMEKKLDPAKFQRVHRSAIVNFDKVKELHPHSNGEYFLRLEGGGEIKVSRTYKDIVGRFL